MDNISDETRRTDENAPNNYQDISDESCGPKHKEMNVEGVSQEETNVEIGGEDEKPLYLPDRGSEKRSSIGSQDTDFGMPILLQHLTIDFKPLEGIDDDEFLLTKCCDFWKLIDGDPKIQDLKVVSMKSTDGEQPTSSSSQTPDSISKLLDDLPKTQAVDWLQKEELFKNTFVTKYMSYYCDEGSREYSLGLPQRNIAEQLRGAGKSSICPLKTRSYTNLKTSSMVTKSSHACPRRKTMRMKVKTIQRTDEVSNLCKELEKWDFSHPKYLLLSIFL